MLKQTEQTRKRNLPREQAKPAVAIAVVVSSLTHAIHRCQGSKTDSATNFNEGTVRAEEAAGTSTGGLPRAGIRAI